MFLLILMGPDYGMSPEAQSVLASSLWVAIWWIGEPIPLGVTSLLPIVLFPLTGGLSLSSTTAAFGHRIVFLVIGGFMIATAVEKWNLHKRIALNIILITGVSMNRLILGFMLSTALLSMWMPNTAATVMILPIGIAIVKQVEGAVQGKDLSNFSKSLMLAIAYAASIGGLATLIGSPPNLIFTGVTEELFGLQITYFDWLLVGMPVALVLLGITWIYLVYLAFPVAQKQIPGGKSEIKSELDGLGKLRHEEKLVLIILSLIGLAWLTRNFILSKFLPSIDDPIIAIAGVVILFLVSSDGRPLLDWKTAVQIPWGVILIFGSGLAISIGFRESGLASWIGEQLSLFEDAHAIVLLLVVIALSNFLTEVTSNTATASIFLPLVAFLAVDIHPYVLMLGATMASVCAFMLPVATPPNAVVYGSGYFTLKDMVRTGFVLNLISILLILLFVRYVLPVLWDLPEV